MNSFKTILETWSPLDHRETKVKEFSHVLDGMSLYRRIQADQALMTTEAQRHREWRVRVISIMVAVLSVFATVILAAKGDLPTKPDSLLIYLAAVIINCPISVAITCVMVFKTYALWSGHENIARVKPVRWFYRKIAHRTKRQAGSLLFAVGLTLLCLGGVGVVGLFHQAYTDGCWSSSTKYSAAVAPGGQAMAAAPGSKRCD
jgi:hypothetical protein